MRNSSKFKSPPQGTETLTVWEPYEKIYGESHHKTDRHNSHRTRTHNTGYIHTSDGNLRTSVRLTDRPQFLIANQKIGRRMKKWGCVFFMSSFFRLVVLNMRVCCGWERLMIMIGLKGVLKNLVRKWNIYFQLYFR